MPMSNETWLVIEAVVLVIALSAVGALALHSFVQSHRQSPDAIDEMVASNNELSRRVRALENDRERDHGAILRMQTRLELHNSYSRALADYSRMLADRLRDLGQVDIPPAPTPPPELTEPLILLPILPQQPLVRDRELSMAIAALFNRDEIDDLAYRLNINYEEIGGETATRRAQSLVAYAKRHGKIEELIVLARQLRPEGEF